MVSSLYYTGRTLYDIVQAMLPCHEVQKTVMAIRFVSELSVFGLEFNNITAAYHNIATMYVCYNY